MLAKYTFYSTPLTLVVWFKYIYSASVFRCHTVASIRVELLIKTKITLSPDIVILSHHNQSKKSLLCFHFALICLAEYPPEVYVYKQSQWSSHQYLSGIFEQIFYGRMPFVSPMGTLHTSLNSGFITISHYHKLIYQGRRQLSTTVLKILLHNLIFKQVF